MSTTIRSQAHVIVGPYKDYVGQAAYDADADLFHGEVLGTRDVITFQGAKVKELAKAFQGSVDDYLAFCRERNEAPEKSVSGKFVVRVEPKLHRDLVRLANLRGISLNKLIAQVLKKAAHSATASDRSGGEGETPKAPAKKKATPKQLPKTHERVSTLTHVRHGDALRSARVTRTLARSV